MSLIKNRGNFKRHPLRKITSSPSIARCILSLLRQPDMHILLSHDPNGMEKTRRRVRWAEYVVEEAKSGMGFGSIFIRLIPLNIEEEEVCLLVEEPLSSFQKTV
ncbi:hypothetical protein CEXT_725631 [Caerostris extrusa]|uniref:Uncharacterized protein n=1 Tax=Caerostris extrusa TaxID=172846 RepID=A0AAV4WZR4_CAEEX|nr:hypothetical protein CEXT_725631 [Caerostris extrusa]